MAGRRERNGARRDREPPARSNGSTPNPDPWPGTRDSRSASPSAVTACIRGNGSRVVIRRAFAEHVPLFDSEGVVEPANRGP